MTRVSLRQVNQGIGLMILPAIFLWNALRLPIPAERALLLFGTVTAALLCLDFFVRPAHLKNNQRLDTTGDILILCTAAVCACIQWLYSQPGLTSSAVLLALLAPTHFIRWTVLYTDRPRRGIGLSAAYLLLCTLAVAIPYLRGHLDLDPLTLLALGSLHLFTIWNLRRVVRQIDTEHDGCDAAERPARHDPLTGLLNRRAFETDAAQLDPAHRHSLIVLDIDRFKAINDGHGHDVGDQVLAALAARLQGLVHFHGEAYRWGGEEFAVLLPDTMGLQAAEIAETIRRRVVEHPVAELSITVSMGTGEWQPELNLRENFVLVDTALRRAKEHGRNRVCHSGRVPVPAHLH